MDPKRQIEKITRTIRNPENAAALERIETNSHLEDIKEGLKPTSKVTSFIQHFLDEVTPKRGVDYLPDEEMQQIKDKAKGEKGDSGNDGKTPEFGIDYFTPEHIEQIKQGIKEEVTPVKDVDYRDGVDGASGRDGKDADEEKIISSVLAKIPKPKDGVSPKIQDIVKATIQHLGSLKGNERMSLKMFRESDDLIGTVSLHKNMMSRMPKSLIDGDQRWHGGGGSGNGGTWITGNNTLPTPGIIGTQNGVNTTFTLPSTPVTILFFYSNGQLLTDLGIDYTLTGTIITMVDAPFSSDILTWRYQ